jgi:hypothetical protein
MEASQLEIKGKNVELDQALNMPVPRLLKDVT